MSVLKIVKFKYFAKCNYILEISRSPASKLNKICSYFKSLKFFQTAILEPLQSHFAKIAHKVAKSKHFFQYLK